MQIEFAEEMMTPAYCVYRDAIWIVYLQEYHMCHETSKLHIWSVVCDSLCEFVDKSEITLWKKDYKNLQ